MVDMHNTGRNVFGAARDMGAEEKGSERKTKIVSE